MLSFYSHVTKVKALAGLELLPKKTKGIIIKCIQYIEMAAF
jgi:hypothetical protein